MSDVAPLPSDSMKPNRDEPKRFELRLRELLRLFILAGRGFMRDEILYRASGLAFDTVLGLVPFMAFLVSALKGFGMYQALMRELIRPGIVSTMMSMGAQQDKQGVGLLAVFLKVLDIVEQASFGTIGVFGLFFLLYIVVLLLVSIEETMNHVFGVERSRSVTRRLADYSAILFITPVFMTLTAGALTGFGKAGLIQGDLPWQLLSAAVMVVGLTTLYWVMPHRRVRLRSALFGGSVAGVSWYVVLSVHVHFQIGVARYNALYSTFAAVPLFLVWLFISWIIVLFGAELAAAHDNPMQHAWRTQGKEVDHASRLFIALSALIVIGDRLGDPIYTLARDVDAVTLGELLRMIEQAWVKAPLVTDGDRRLKGLLEKRVLAREPSTEQMTLRQLVSQWERGEGSAETTLNDAR